MILPVIDRGLSVHESTWTQLVFCAMRILQVANSMSHRGVIELNAQECNMSINNRHACCMEDGVCWHSSPCLLCYGMRLYKIRRQGCGNLSARVALTFVSLRLKIESHWLVTPLPSRLIWPIECSSQFSQLEKPFILFIMLAYLFDLRSLDSTPFGSYIVALIDNPLSASAGRYLTASGSAIASVFLPFW